MCFFRFCMSTSRLSTVAVKLPQKCYKKRGPNGLPSGPLFLYWFYSGLGAPTGQTSAQLPQSMHLSASIT